MKRCPYCAEEIQDEAIVCRWCGRDLRLSPYQADIQRIKTTRILFVLIYLGMVAVVYALGIGAVTYTYVHPEDLFVPAVFSSVIPMVGLGFHVAALFLVIWFSREINIRWYFVVLFSLLVLGLANLAFFGLLVTAHYKLRKLDSFTAYDLDRDEEIEDARPPKTNNENRIYVWSLVAATIFLVGMVAIGAGQKDQEPRSSALPTEKKATPTQHAIKITPWASATKTIGPATATPTQHPIRITPWASTTVENKCPDGCKVYTPGCRIKALADPGDWKWLEPMTYYLPDDPDYQGVPMDYDLGALWFCRQEDAEAKGFHK